MKKITFSILLLSVSLCVVSCKKKIYGCTDSTAVNFSIKATVDDGSCFKEEASQNVIIENFNGSFNSSDATDIYIPSFTPASGDIIVLEVLYDDVAGNKYWTPLNYSDGDLHIIGSYSESSGIIEVGTYNGSGTTYPWSNPQTIEFRAALIKKSEITKNPNVVQMSIDEIESLD